MISRNISEWKPYLHDLGRVEVKHGLKLEVVNFYNQDAGNSQLPGKLKSAARKRSTKKWMLAAAAVLIVGNEFCCVAHRSSRTLGRFVAISFRKEHRGAAV